MSMSGLLHGVLHRGRQLVLAIVAFVGVMLLLVLTCGCLLDPGQIGFANRQTPTAVDTESEQDFAAGLETVAADIGELVQTIKSVNEVVTKTVGANSGDNWTTRIFVGGLVVVGSVAVCWHRRRFHRAEKCAQAARTPKA